MADKKNEEIEVMDKKTIEKYRKELIEDFEKNYKADIVKELSEQVSKEVNTKFDREYRLGIIDDVTTDVKDEIKNQIYKEERKMGRSKSFKIFRLSVYLLILLAALGYAAYRLYKTDSFELLKYDYQPSKPLTNPIKDEDHKDDPKNKEDKTEEKVDYKELYGNMLDNFKIYDYSLYKKSIKASDMTNVQKLQIAYSTLTDDDKELDGSIITIKSSTLSKAYKDVFGTDDFKDESFNVYNLNFVFSLAKNEYIGIMYVENTDDVVYELIDANEDDNYIILKAYVAKVSNGKIYNIKTNRELGSTSHKISEYGNKASIVTFKFTKDKVFHSVSCE